MSDNTDDKSSELSARLRSQIDLQQSEESLRHVRNEIVLLNNQIRKYQQDYMRAKLILNAAEAKLKLLKGEEFDLNQNTMRQKRTFISSR